LGASLLIFPFAFAVCSDLEKKASSAMQHSANKMANIGVISRPPSTRRLRTTFISTATGFAGRFQRTAATLSPNLFWGVSPDNESGSAADLLVDFPPAFWACTGRSTRNCMPVLKDEAAFLTFIFVSRHHSPAWKSPGSCGFLSHRCATCVHFRLRRVLRYADQRSLRTAWCRR
jgi:hypothetical protein